MRQCVRERDSGRATPLDPPVGPGPSRGWWRDRLSCRRAVAATSAGTRAALPTRVVGDDSSKSTAAGLTTVATHLPRRGGVRRSSRRGHAATPCDSAVQIVDDGSGAASRQRPRRSLGRSVPRSHHRRRLQGRSPSWASTRSPRASTRAYARSRDRRRGSTLTLAPASLAPWLASIGATAIERVLDRRRRTRRGPRRAPRGDPRRIPTLVRVAAAAGARPTAAWSGLEMQGGAR